MAWIAYFGTTWTVAPAGLARQHVHIHTEPECEPRIVYRYPYFGRTSLWINLRIDIADHPAVLAASVSGRGDGRLGSYTNRDKIVLQKVRFDPDGG